MAVAAIDRRLRIASFSNGGLNAQGGHIDMAGPGVGIRSSWPRPVLYRSIDGTSMATPHVAGIAALYAQIDPKFRGRVLMSLLTQSASDCPWTRATSAPGWSRHPDGYSLRTTEGPYRLQLNRRRARKMNKLRVNVSVSEDHKFEKVARAAKKAGLAIDQSLDTIGVVTGTIDAEKLETLRGVEGIDNVESERDVSVAPREARCSSRQSPLPDMLPQERDGAVARDAGCLAAPGCVALAVEGVAGLLVSEDLD